MDIYGQARKNLSLIHELLGKISYKPEWNFKVFEMPNDFTIVVQATYDGYESDNAVFLPLRYETEQGTRVREVLGRSVGQSVRKPQKRYYRKSFDLMSFHDMRPEHLIQYVIAQTIKEAELAEFDRWFKVEGVAIFERDRSS